MRKKLEQLQVRSHFYIEKQLKAKRESRQKRAAKVQYTEDIWLKQKIDGKCIIIIGLPHHNHVCLT